MLFKHVLVSSMSFLINMWFGNHRSSSSLFPPCSSYVAPSLLHRWSIATPSKRWTIDGVTMEYRWSIFGERAMSISRFFSLMNVLWKKEKGQIIAAMRKNLTFVIFYLCRLALCSRYFAFCLAEPEPWAPVMYFFFFALVLTFPSSCLGLVPPRENEIPLTRISSKSFAIY